MIPYDHVAHMETLGDDLPFILPKLGATEFLNNFPGRTEHQASETSDVYTDMYTGVSKAVMDQVVAKYKADVDMFGYSFSGYVKEAAPGQ